MRFMLTPSPNDAGYGGHIWLNRARPRGAAPALWPDRGPNDLFACIGHQGQYIIVSPSQQVTIVRSEEHTSELQSLMRISYDVFCLKKKKSDYLQTHHIISTQPCSIQAYNTHQQLKRIT